MRVRLLLQTCFHDTAWPTLLGSGKQDPHSQQVRAPPACHLSGSTVPVVAQELHDADHNAVLMKKGNDP
jgi:hypothetical protein